MGGRFPIEECSRRWLTSADVRDGRELELRVGSPHAVGDELGLVAMNEDSASALRTRLQTLPTDVSTCSVSEFVIERPTFSTQR